MATKYQIPAMIESGGGSLVLVSSFVGYTIGMPNMSAYAASKAGIIGLTKSLATECAQYGIRVNALLPGGTDTPMGREASNTPEALAFVKPDLEKHQRSCNYMGISLGLRVQDM